MPSPLRAGGQQGNGEFACAFTRRLSERVEEFIPFVFFFICIFIFQKAAHTEFVAGMKTNPGERTGKQLPMNRSTLATNGVRVSTIHG